MRASGLLEAPSVEPGGHACWVFDDHDDFARVASEFLAEGASRNERVVYVADRDVDEMRADLELLGDVDSRIRRGELLVHSTHGLYEPGGCFDTTAQVETYHQLTREALAEGFTGLRVAADATALVTTPESRRQFMRYELLVDRLMATAPMSALCAYDARALGPAAAEMAAVHPLRHGTRGCEPGLCAFVDAPALRLCGEVDLVTHELFTVILDAAECTAEQEVVIDLAGVEFIDVHGITRLALLQRRLDAQRRQLRIVGASSLVHRCADLLGFDRLVSQGGPR